MSILAALLVMLNLVTQMPGQSFKGTPPPADPELLALSSELRRHVDHLAGTIGERHHGRPEALTAARDYIDSELKSYGYAPLWHGYDVFGHEAVNINAQRHDVETSAPIFVIGAHYDSIPDCPAANDNASGVAATLVLARLFRDQPTSPTLRFVFFANEEPPYFQTSLMGSVVAAERSRDLGENIVGMISLETIGYFSDEPGSQYFPEPLGGLYPDTGNFIAFVGMSEHQDFIKRTIADFRRTATIPSEGLAGPEVIQGVGWSDHWAYWRAGYPALMITDTAPFRYPHYHRPADTPDKLDYENMARIVVALRSMFSGDT